MGLAMDFSKLETQDVLDLAIAAEKEARDHYDQISTWMTGRGNAEVAEFFKMMAGLEQIHCDQLDAQRRRMFGDRPPRYLEGVAWEVEAPNYDQIEMDMSVRAALEAALGAEVKAYEYYAGALEYATDPGVVALFEELRSAEQQHQVMIRRLMARLEGKAEPDA
jgi:rubrerythrin